MKNSRNDNSQTGTESVVQFVYLISIEEARARSDFRILAYKSERMVCSKQQKLRFCETDFLEDNFRLSGTKVSIIA